MRHLESYTPSKVQGDVLHIHTRDDKRVETSYT